MVRYIIILLWVFSLEAQESLGIFTYQVYGAKPWDPSSIQSGITGSEEAVIYMADKLAQLGYQVIVFGIPPTDSPYSLPESNPRYVSLDFTEYPKLDIAISWRMVDAGERLKQRANRVYLWPHDTPPNGTISDALVMSFDGVLWLSDWQRGEWIKANPHFAKFETIFGNGINPEQMQPITERTNPYSCIYGSNYARGLVLLLDCWPTIKQHYPEATLDIYYGWQHWGLLSPETEASMRRQVEELAPLGVKEHGLVSHKELSEAYAKASFWTYPCYCPEVFCITALRAQAAGAVPVIINGSALPATVRHGYKCEGSLAYCQLLLSALSQAKTISLADRVKMREFILEEYTWEKIAIHWKEHFSK